MAIFIHYIHIITENTEYRKMATLIHLCEVCNHYGFIKKSWEKYDKFKKKYNHKKYCTPNELDISINGE